MNRGTISMCFSVACNVLEFDMMELWYMDENSNNLDQLFKYQHGSKQSDICQNTCSTLFTSSKDEIALLCCQALLSPNKCYWGFNKALNLTEMVYLANTDNNSSTYLIGKSSKMIQFKDSKLKFLTGIGQATYIAAFQLEDRTKQFEINSTNESNEDISVPVAVFVEDRSKSVIVADPLTTITEKVNLNRDLPIKHIIPMEIHSSAFCNVAEQSSKSEHCDIYLAHFRNQRVIIKMLKKDVCESGVRDFLEEQQFSMRIDHPNIIRILGCGKYPRPFSVFEYLGGGTLTDQIKKRSNPVKSMFKNKSSQDSFYDTILASAREIASGIDYLHNLVSDEISIVHRDLRPDNIGFTTSGTLKVFDFGLSKCIISHSSDDEVFEMTGCTGCLRYMAPENLLQQPYNEKVDVYSFGVILWQMMSSKVPFQEFNKQRFFDEVVMGSYTLPIENKWPICIQNLIKKCTDKNYIHRPSFHQIIEELEMEICVRKNHSNSTLPIQRERSSLWF
eukprot:gene5042-7036_t